MSLRVRVAVSGWDVPMGDAAAVTMTDPQGSLFTEIEKQVPTPPIAAISILAMLCCIDFVVVDQQYALA